MITQRSIFVAVSTLVLMAFGCGGGGGGGTLAPTPTPPPASQLPITPANAQAVSTDVIQAITSTFDLLDVVDFAGLPLPDLAARQRALSDADASPFARFASVRANAAGGTPTRAVIVDTENCDTGSLTSTWNDADDNLELSTGDTVDAAFADCFFSLADVTLNGDVGISSVVTSGDVQNGNPPWSLSALFGFTNLQGTDAVDTALINGAMTLAASTSDGLQFDASVAGDSLSVMQNGETETLSNFSFAQAIDVNAQSTTVDANGTLTSTELNGAVTFTTLQNFVIVGDDNPSAGQLRISHTSSSVLVTAVDNLNVQLEIDADGDGTAETTQVVSWDVFDLD